LVLVHACVPEGLPSLIGQLEGAKAAAWTRLTAPRKDGGTDPANGDDRNLDAAEAARRLGISRDWLYRNAARLPFAVRIGRRVLFSAQGLDRWNRSRTAR
jgi:excisionase family DNA binding protein